MSNNTGDRVVAHAVDLPLGITRYPVGVYLGDVFGNQAKLRVIGIVVLEVKRHWFKSQDAFAASLGGRDRVQLGDRQRAQDSGRLWQ